MNGYDLDYRLFTRLPLEQLERGLAIAHAAAGPKDAFNALRIRILRDPFEEWGVVFEATDTVIAAQRFIRSEHCSYGLEDTGPDACVILPADSALRMWAAVKQQIVTDRGKYDPTGWDVAINRTPSRNPETVSMLPDVEFVLVDVFHERRLETNTSQWQGKFPDIGALFERAGMIEPVARVRYSVKQSTRVVKSIGASVDVSPIITMHGLAGPITYELKGTSGWRAIQATLDFGDVTPAAVDESGEEE